MFILVYWIQLLFAYEVNTASPFYPAPSDAAIDKILESLEERGDAVTAVERTKIPTLKQYLTFSIVSEEEIFNEIAIPPERMITVHNVEVKPCKGTKCMKNHGEFKIIHDGTLSRKIQEFKVDKPNVKTYVVLFSYYIPCYGNGGVPYSCAEELSNFVYAQNRRLEMIVGYRTA